MAADFRLRVDEELRELGYGLEMEGINESSQGCPTCVTWAVSGPGWL